MGFTEEEDRRSGPSTASTTSKCPKLADERVRMIRDYAADFYDADRRAGRQPGGHGPRPRSPEERGQSEVLRAGEDRALPADGAAISPGRAPVAVAHRPADRGRAPGGTGGTGRKGRTMTTHATGVAALLVVAASVSLDADRDPPAKRQGDRGHVHRRRQQERPVLLDDGIVSEVPLAEAVAVEFSSRKPPPPAAPPAAPAAPTKPAAAAPTKAPAAAPRPAVTVPAGYAGERAAGTGHRRRRLAGRPAVQGGRRRPGDGRRHRSSSRAARQRRSRPCRSPSPVR